MIHLLLIDGVKYQLWTPKDEEKEFHPIIREHAKEIFGENSFYFDVRHTLKTASGIGSIPDAYVISLKERYQWFVVENELASHPVYDHIVKQLTKFINGIENQNAKSQILDILYDEINKNPVLKATVRKLIDTEDVYHLLSKLFSKPPRIVIIIDQKTPEIEEACRVLKYQTDIVEFKTYVRENAETVHVHSFEPLYAIEQTHEEGTKRVPTARVRVGEITSQGSYTLPILETLAEMGGTGRMSDVLEEVYKKMKDKLTPKDLETLPSGIGIRWKNKAQWERQKLKTEGYLKKDSHFGIWEITNEGRKYYENLKAKQ
jgi:hypothetical protein